MKKTVLLIAAVSAGVSAVVAKKILGRCRKCRKPEKPACGSETDEKEAVTFTNLAMSLADDYASVYYLNIEDDSYVEYSAVGSDHKLRVISSGDDFFADTQINCRILVYEEDQERFLEAFRKEKLLEIIRSGGTFTLDYRLVIDGKPTYYSLKTCRALEFDPKHIVIGVRNVDKQIRRELELEEVLNSANDLAERDGLTGVKNKSAYTRAEQELNDSIADGTCGDFAVVVCDVNGLKNINDTMGHQAGYEHLKSACTMICRVFKRSPVYRIGGDEFAVMLTGEDYRAREILTRQLREQMKFNQADGLVTVACGMAVFIPDKDKTVSAVFNRADAAMYRNKKQFSGVR